MAEAPNTQTQEPRKPMTRAMKLRAATLLSVLVAIPGIGGFVGYKLGESSANASRADAIAAANQDKNCIKLESGHVQSGQAVVVRIGSLTARQQVECGVDWVSSNTDTDNQYSTSTPQGTIVKPDIEVLLPSVSSLDDNIQHEYAQAANPYSTSNKILDPVLGVLGGATVEILGLSVISSMIDRRRRQSEHPPQNAEAVSS